MHVAGRHPGPPQLGSGCHLVHRLPALLSADRTSDRQRHLDELVAGELVEEVGELGPIEASAAGNPMSSAT
jgi:hypothetical protein